MSKRTYTFDDGYSVPVYKWGEWPEHLRTKNQLSDDGFQTGKNLPPVAAICYRTKSPDGIMRLYDSRQATPKRKLSPAQAAALEKAKKAAGDSWNCTECGGPLWRRNGRYHSRRVQIKGGGLCQDCLDKQDRRNDKIAAAEWARSMLQRDDIVILDTETSGLYDAEIVEFSAIDINGTRLIDTLVKPRNIDKLYQKSSRGISAYDIHGIGRDELNDAPSFDEIYPSLVEILTDKTILIYNADYDWPLIQDHIKAYNLPPIQVLRKPLYIGQETPTTDDVQCIMERFAEYYGEWSDYHRSYTWQPLNGGHRALGDCAAARQLLLQMAAWTP